MVIRDSRFQKDSKCRPNQAEQTIWVSSSLASCTSQSAKALCLHRCSVLAWFNVGRRVCKDLAKLETPWRRRHWHCKCANCPKCNAKKASMTAWALSQQIPGGSPANANSWRLADPANIICMDFSELPGLVPSSIRKTPSLNQRVLDNTRHRHVCSCFSSKRL